MREILFRGKRIGDGKWFEGYTPAYMMAVVGNIYDNPELLDVTE